MLTYDDGVLAVCDLVNISPPGAMPVQQLQKNMPRTIVLVTHQLDEALLLGQSVTVMHELGETETFDLSYIPYPRDLSSPELLRLREAVTEACRR